MEEVVAGQYPTVSHRAWSVVAHLLVVISACLGAGGAWAFALPLGFRLALGHQAPLLDHHSKAALNLSLWVSVGFFLGWFLSQTPYGLVWRVACWLILGGCTLWRILRAARSKPLFPRLPQWVG